MARALRPRSSLVTTALLLGAGVAAVGLVPGCAAGPKATPPEKTAVYGDDVGRGVDPIEVTRTSVDRPGDPSTEKSAPKAAPSAAVGGAAGAPAQP